MVSGNIETQCPDCNILYKVDRNHIGRFVKCKKCEKAFKIEERQALRPDTLSSREGKGQAHEKPSKPNSKKESTPSLNHSCTEIECPHCGRNVTINPSSFQSNSNLVTCSNCHKEFQTVNVPNTKNRKTSSNSVCPFCGAKGPDNAIKCNACGKFKKQAKVTITKIKNGSAKSCLIEKLESIPGFQNKKLDLLQNNLPWSFQIDYPTAIELEITLRNKGVVLKVDEGNLSECKKNETKEKIEVATSQNEFLSKLKFETVLRDMRKTSSIFKTIIGIIFSQRKDLLIISLIVIIPFFSLGLDEEKQIIFFPIFLGVLWAYIILSFYGDGNVPLFNVFKSFLFSSTITVFMVYLLGYFANFFNFLPKLPKLFIDVGIIEEICKIAPIFLLIRRAQSKPLTIRYLDIFVISMICGIGFGTCENILYKVYIDNLIQLSAIYKPPLVAGLSNSHLLRLISLPFLHGCWSGVLGVIIFHGYHQKQLKHYLLWGIVTIGGLHTIYDYFVSEKTLGILLVFISILLINVTFIMCCYMDKMKMRILKESFVVTH